jgi:hypothetical protein
MREKQVIFTHSEDKTCWRCCTRIRLAKPRWCWQRAKVGFWTSALAGGRPEATSTINPYNGHRFVSDANFRLADHSFPSVTST